VWDASIRDYPSEELRRIFAAHGIVEDVVIRNSKKKKRQVSIKLKTPCTFMMMNLQLLAFTHFPHN